MIVSESEAKEKWCPFVDEKQWQRRVLHNSNNEISCIGSRCMAWRHYDALKGNDKRGWCGLAGNPR